MNNRGLAIAGGLGALALLIGFAANAQDPEYAVANIHDEKGNFVGILGFEQAPAAGIRIVGDGNIAGADVSSRK